MPLLDNRVVQLIIVFAMIGLFGLVLRWTFRRDVDESTAFGDPAADGGRGGDPGIQVFDGELVEGPSAAAQQAPNPPADGPATDPPSGAPPTNAPPTNAPPTNAPPTGAPTTGAPTTGVPPTGAPTTGAPASGVPATGVPTSGVPATGVPTTGVPTAPAAPATPAGDSAARAAAEPDDYGLLVPAATLDSAERASRVRDLITKAGIRATVASGRDGRHRVLVFGRDLHRARRAAGSDSAS